MNITPGPWGYTGRSETGHVDSIYIYSKNPECKRQTCVGEVYMDDAEPQSTEANARLIAAAPDLLEHLKTALEYLSRQTPQAKINELFRAARPLLRKVEKEGTGDE